MRVLLCSTYELGHQPLGVAGPAGALLGAGHDVETADLSLEEWPAGAIGRAGAIVFSVPMHTATELAVRAARRIERDGPRPPFAFVGLYASVLEDHPVLGPSDLLAAGETAEALALWLEQLSAAGVATTATVATVATAATAATVATVATASPERRPIRTVVDLGPPLLPGSAPPARHLLPSLDRYARYLAGGRSELAASVEASRGCNHRCRHCPVASVYGGRSRAVPVASVLADVAQVVEMGATHVSFADPDFLNRPAHALAVADGLHDRFPAISFDATVKIEHVLRHRSCWPALRRSGLRFVVSAFESTDDDVLSILDKGHTAADEAEAVAVLRSAGVEVHPSWLPFTPWTTLGSLGRLLEFSALADLAGSTDAVQYTIRLLLPRGSLLMASPDPVLEAATLAAGPPEPEPGSPAALAGNVAWRHSDARIDELQQLLSSLVEEDSASGCPAEETFAKLWSSCRLAGVPLAGEPPEADPRYASAVAGPERPRLSEAWFCCAEPTAAQLGLVAN